MATIVFAVGAVPGCKEDEPPPPPLRQPDNLTLERIAILSRSSAPMTNGWLYVGHPTRVGVTIRSVNSLEDVAIQLFITDSDGYDSDPDTSPTFHIDTVTVDVVRGTHTYELVLPVPYTTLDLDPTEDVDKFADPVFVGQPIPPGLYYLFASVDPGDAIPETDETDNAAVNADLAEPKNPVTVSRELVQYPNVYVDELSLALDLRMVDTEFLSPEPDTVPTPEDYCEHDQNDPDPTNPFDQAIENVGNTHLALSALVNLSGTPAQDVLSDAPNPAPLSEVRLYPTIVWEAPGETIRIPLQVWDSENDTHSDYLPVHDLEHRVPRRVTLDVRLDGGLDQDVVAKIESLRDRLETAAPSCLDLTGGECSTRGLLQCLAPVGFPLVGDSIEDCIGEDLTTCVSGCFNRAVGSAKVEIQTRAVGRHVCGLFPVPRYCFGQFNARLNLPSFDFSAPIEVSGIGILPPLDYVIPEDVCRRLESDPFFSYLGNLDLGECEETIEDRTLRGPQTFDAGFDLDVGDSNGGARANFSAGATLSELGASATASSHAILSFLGDEVEVLTLDAHGGASPFETSTRERGNYFYLSLTSGLSLAPGSAVIAPIHLAPCDPASATYDQNLLEVVNEAREALCLQRCVDDCMNPPQGQTRAECERRCPDRCEPRSMSLSEEFDERFVVAGIPVRVEGMGEAGIGFQAGVELPGCDDGDDRAFFRAHAGPYAEITGALRAAVGIETLIEGFAEGDVTLLRDTFFARAQVGQLQLNDSTITGTLGQDVVNTLTGPNGKGSYGYDYACKLAWGLPPWDTCTKKRKLFSFDTFEKTDVLYCDSQPVTVVLP